MKATVLLVFLICALLLVSCHSENNQNKKSKSIIGTTLNSNEFKGGYSDVNGLRMYYELHGDTGDYLVLVHGGGSTIGTTFGRVLPFLSLNHKVIAVELQAHGHTSDRNSNESFEQDADDVAQLLSNLKISKASFFGFSNGGNTVMQISIRHPEIVNRIIIASAFYKRDGMIPGFFESMKKVTLIDMPPYLRNAFLEINPDSIRLFTMFNKDRDRMLKFQDWNDEMLSSIKAPTLILSGDHDVVLPDHAVAMSGLIKNSRLMILPSTHGYYIGADNPDPASKLIEMTVMVIEEFLRDEK